ncbi:MAG: cation:proton antiporter [Henriciella sp.]|nr:cation:proton antiporter [Henriciella sp.]
MADPSLSPVEALMPAMVLLGVGGASAVASKVLKLSPIVGYLAAGVLIGPHVFGVIEENATTHLLAELGVVFLLFDIGMHVSVREMRESGRDMIGLAPTHMVLAGVPFTIALGLFGLPWPAAIAIGISLALSSTAVVSRIIDERNLNSCPLGRSAIHVLIFQDIVAIFLLIFASSLGGDSGNLAITMGQAAIAAFVAFGAAILAGRYLMGPVLQLLISTRNQEAFTAATLFLVLAAAAATATMGLSLTLGAFLAGLAVSGTSFRHQIQTETGPFRGLLLSFFFMSVGLMLDVPALIANLPLVIFAAITILLFKTMSGMLAGLLNGWSKAGTTQLGFLLAQGSEFTLVVMAIIVAASDIVSPFAETIIVAGVALSLAAAPVWAGLGMRLSRLIAARRKDAPVDAPSSGATATPVVIFGMTDAGRLAADALTDNDIPFVAFDADPDRFMSAIADGYQVLFGDASNLKLVEAAGAAQARAIVIGAPRYEVSKAITPAVERNFPGTPRFVSVTNDEDEARFSALGMHAWLSVTEPHGIEMAADILQELGIDEDRISEWLKTQSERYHIEDRSEDVIEIVEEAA